MAEILKGAPVAAALNNRTAEQVLELKKAGVSPTLAILRVGDKPDDIAYQRSAVKRCEGVGIFVREIALAQEVSQAELLREIDDLNADDHVHGVLLLRPLPKTLDEEAVRGALAPDKDVDGITDASLAGVFTGGGAGYAPCTAQACMEILDFYGIDPKGKRAVVVGRSLVVGKPAAMLLLGRHATVTICHTRTVDMPAVCRGAELLVVSAGRANMLDARYFSPDQTVIDVGINVTEDGALCGDVDFAAAEGIVAALTPVPGGVGTVTTSVLAKHVVLAAAKAEEARRAEAACDAGTRPAKGESR